MRAFRGLLLAVLLLPSSASHAGGLKSTGDVIDARFGDEFDWLSPNQYILVARSGEGDGKGKLFSRTYTIFDLSSRGFVQVHFPMREFARRFQEEYLLPEPVHFDGRVLFFWVEVGRRTIYAGRVNAESGALSEFTKLG